MLKAFLYTQVADPTFRIQNIERNGTYLNLLPKSGSSIHITRKGGLENLILTRNIASKGDSERQQAICLTSLCEWMGERRARTLTKGEKLLRVKPDRNLGRAVIAYERGT